MKIVGGWPRGALPQKTPQNQENPKESLRKTNKNHRILIKTREGGEQERRRRGEEERRRRGEEEKKGEGEEEKGERRKFKRGGGANTHTLRCPLEAGIFLYRAPRKTTNEKHKKNAMPQDRREQARKRRRGGAGQRTSPPPPFSTKHTTGRAGEEEKKREGEEEKGERENSKEGGRKTPTPLDVPIEEGFFNTAPPEKATNQKIKEK